MTCVLFLDPEDTPSLGIQVSLIRLLRCRLGTRNLETDVDT